MKINKDLIRNRMDEAAILGSEDVLLPRTYAEKLLKHDADVIDSMTLYMARQGMQPNQSNMNDVIEVIFRATGMSRNDIEYLLIQRPHDIMGLNYFVDPRAKPEPKITNIIPPMNQFKF